MSIYYGHLFLYMCAKIFLKEKRLSFYCAIVHIFCLSRHFFKALYRRNWGEFEKMNPNLLKAKMHFLLPENANKRSRTPQLRRRLPQVRPHGRFRTELTALRIFERIYQRIWAKSVKTKTEITGTFFAPRLTQILSEPLDHGKGLDIAAGQPVPQGGGTDKVAIGLQRFFN